MNWPFRRNGRVFTKTECKFVGDDKLKLKITVGDDISPVEAGESITIDLNFGPGVVICAQGEGACIRLTHSDNKGDDDERGN